MFLQISTTLKPLYYRPLWKSHLPCGFWCNLQKTRRFFQSGANLTFFFPVTSSRGLFFLLLFTWITTTSDFILMPIREESKGGGGRDSTCGSAFLTPSADEIFELWLTLTFWLTVCLNKASLVTMCVWNQKNQKNTSTYNPFNYIIMCYLLERRRSSPTK